MGASNRVCRHCRQLTDMARRRTEFHVDLPKGGDKLRIDDYVDDKPANGIFRVNSNAFSDPALLDLEFRFIFERTWSFLGIESQIRNPDDFFTTHIGRVPILVTRGQDGEIHAFVNVCRHKGALLCRSESGTARVHFCQYHGWGYDAGGRNRGIKDREAGAYTKAFDSEDHDLIPLKRLESYKGLVFGSLSGSVPPLADYLGGVRSYIDLAMDQSENGMEFIPGRICYSYGGNWKLQMDNGLDHYHLTSTHTSFLHVQSRRVRENTDLSRGLRQYDWDKRAVQEAGVGQFPYGHAAVWIDQPEPERRPIYPSIGSIAGRIGEDRAAWMLKLRNATIFPSMQIAESTSLLFRTFRPISVRETEMRVFCLAPIGEGAEQRAWRIRQFEDFFNPSGLATPDDTALYESCQRGFESRRDVWLQGYARGLAALSMEPAAMGGPPGEVPTAGLKAPFKLQNEVCFHPAWREWARLLQAGHADIEPYAR